MHVHLHTRTYLLGLVLLLAACGTPPQSVQTEPSTPTVPLIPTVLPTPTISANVPQGYLAVRQTDVAFLQWTEDQYNQITGRYQRVYIAPGDGFGVEAENGPMTLTKQQGSNDVQVNFNGQESYIGTLAGDTLTLVMPTSSGELQTIEFKRASVEEYNEAARTFRQAAEQQAATAAAQQAQLYATAAAQQARVNATATAQAVQTQAERTWQSAYQDANAALEGLAVASREDWFTERDEGQTAVAVRNVQARLNEVKATLSYEDCQYNLQYNVSTVQYEADQLQYIGDNFDYTKANLNAALTSMQKQRDVLGAAATDVIVNETSRLADVAKQQIDLVDQKYVQAEQLVQAIVEEANGLTCE